MALTPAQVKGRIKNVAKENHADARNLMRIFMMERFLERVASSAYSEKFIIKGGILVTSMIGVSLRSTMDIDTMIQNFNLSEQEALRIVREICDVDVNDDVIFKVKEAKGIMDEMEYPGIRIGIDAVMGNMITPIKIDISTGDVITPRAIEYEYKFMLEDKSIKLWTYNLETIMAEKLQTVLARGILNTRMRDYYDIHILKIRYANDIKNDILKNAFKATCMKRGTEKLLTMGDREFEKILHDNNLIKLWKSYQEKYSYAKNISYEDIIGSVKQLVEICINVVKSIPTT
jgi:predicted nucleotidyltransferase component of viral defense system